MSDRVLGTALLALVLLPRLYDAQAIGELRRRADSVADLWREASTFADLQDSLERIRGASGRDTIRAGSLVIVANGSPLPLQDAAERAWRALDSLYGSAARGVAEHPLVVHGFDESDTTHRSEPIRADLDVPASLDVVQLARVLL